MKKLFFCLACFALASCSDPKYLRFGPDKYTDFYALAADNSEGRDYSVEVYDRNSPATVLAIHGGELEKATSSIARAVAGKDFNLYLFNAWLGKKSKKLHVTAVNFNDARALALVLKSSAAVSIHAQADKGKVVCLGGRNERLRDKISASLAAGGFATETPCKRLPGVSEKNIVNRASGGGAQLEITLNLLNELAEDRYKLLKFSNIIKNALEEYLKTENAEKGRE